MIILGIETSCDETAVCLVEANGGLEQPSFTVLGNGLYSQAKIHAHYGGVFPALAKREHAKNLVPLLEKALTEAKLPAKNSAIKFDKEKVRTLLEREGNLAESLLNFIGTKTAVPNIDAIAVTAGPGLEPALWVGINFALALSEIWNIPVYPTNHMAGHLFSPLIADGNNKSTTIKFPALALLISGGHTELVLTHTWNKHEVVGQTRDDAVGEAFDKVARLLGLPYPGGPEISKLAAEERTKNPVPVQTISLPRPMLDSDDLAFSFSGLKTAVLYLLKKFETIDDNLHRQVAREFEDAATEVLVGKTEKAIILYKPITLIVAGGVSANTYIRKAFEELIKRYPEIRLLIPPTNLSTDNAVMIAAAAYINILSGQKPETHIVARGNASL